MAADAGELFSIEDATIEDIHAAYRSGRATALGVARAHLERIAAYDRRGPTLSAIILTNPNALADAAALDAAFADKGDMAGPLHGIPVLVKTYPPKLNGDRDTTPAGSTTWIASGLHWPAAVVPMGYTYENLPSGLQIIGRPWSEPILLAIAYAYEQATRHRKPPKLR